MNRKTSLVWFFIFLGMIFSNFVFGADFNEKIQELILVYSQSAKGVQDPKFIEKVNEIDNELREKLEKEHDIIPFKQLMTSAEKFKTRKSAQAMFEVVLQKAYKRLQFTKAQGEISDATVSTEISKLIRSIEKYLDPSKPDEDTVDRNKLEAKRKNLKEKIKKIKASILKTPEGKRISVEVTDEKGSPGKISPIREKNLLAKLKNLIPEPEKMSVKISLKPDSFCDMHVFVKNFVGPSGFAVIEGEMDFVNIALSSLDNSESSNYAEVLDDNHFKRYRVVQDEDQLNVMPNAGNTAYEMGSFMPGQSFKMEFRKPDGISTILKELEGDDRFIVLNKKSAVNDKLIEIKNNGAKDLIFLQGTDLTGLCSVKAIGTLHPKDGTVSFKEILLVVDDNLASDITRFVGEFGINFFLKRASENLRKGLPFTPILEKLAFERGGDGKQVFIFSGRGKNNL